MNQLKITNGFDKLTDAGLVVKAHTILAAMTGNADFPAPSPTLAVVLQATTDFETAVSVAEAGGTYDKAFKNEKRKALISLLHSLGNYVLFTVNGDRVKAVGSGFSIAKIPAPAPPITRPENLRLMEGNNTGELKLRFKRVSGARSYMVQYAQEPVTDATSWQNLTGTVSKYTITQLDSGKKYQVRVAAVGTHNQLMYSDAVGRIVQ